MQSRSSAIVSFIANLLPLYDGERHGDLWCARSMQDGTLIVPVDESAWDEERGTVLIRWQGDAAREQLVEGTYLATLALVRFVELNGLGLPQKVVRLELEQLAQHFYFKTGCHLDFPANQPSSNLNKAVFDAVQRLGESTVTSLLLRAAGL
jgi:hypothetical protein